MASTICCNRFSGNFMIVLAPRCNLVELSEPSSELEDVDVDDDDEDDGGCGWCPCIIMKGLNMGIIVDGVAARLFSFFVAFLDLFFFTFLLFLLWLLKLLLTMAIAVLPQVI